MVNRTTFIAALLFLFTNTLFAENQNEKEAKYNAKFKTLAFEGNFLNLFYLESKEYKPSDTFENSVSSEREYRGNQIVEFFKEVIERPPSETDLIKEKLGKAIQKETQIGDEYNKVLSEMIKYTQSIPDLGQANSSQSARISAFQNELDELKVKMEETKVNRYNEELRHRELLESENKATTIGNSKPQKPIETPKPKYEPFAKFPIPTSGGSYILIFNKTPNGVTISPINDAPGVFPFGSYQFFNLAGTTVELRFGSKVISLSPNGRTVFKPEIANGEYLEGEFWTKVDDEFKLGYKFRNLHISRVRTLAFIMPTAPGQSALNLKIAEERGQVESPPAEKPKSKDKKDKESEKKENENRPFG